MQDAIRTSLLGAVSPSRYREGKKTGNPVFGVAWRSSVAAALEKESSSDRAVAAKRTKPRRSEELRESKQPDYRQASEKPPVPTALPEPAESCAREEEKPIVSTARPERKPVQKKGLIDVVAALYKRYGCVGWLEEKGTPLRPGHYVTADVDGDEVIVGAMVVEASFVHPDNRQALKLRPVVALGTWKKFQDAEFWVNLSTLLYGVPAGYRGKQIRLFEEFFRILEHCRYGLTPVADRGKPKRQRYTMPYEEGPIVFRVG